jgi:hypothetical protein
VAVATPTSSTGSGTYHSTMMVALGCATPGATIHYTTDGSTPTSGSAVYSTPLTISATQTIKAYAVHSGELDSGVLTVALTILPWPLGANYVVGGAGSAGYNGTYVDQGVDGNGYHYYELDSSHVLAFSPEPDVCWNLADTVAHANASGGMDAAYSIALTTVGGSPTAPNPPVGSYFVPGYSSMQGTSPAPSVAFADTTPTVASASIDSTGLTLTIGWTVTGTAPVLPASGGTGLSLVGMTHGAVTLSGVDTSYVTTIATLSRALCDDETVTLSYTPGNFEDSASAAVTGFSGQAVTNRSTAPPLTCATPTASPGAGTYVGTQNVTLSCATGGATIHYTTDGSGPTTGSPTYSTAISVSASETLKAIAVLTDYDNSGVLSAAYTIEAACATPTASPGAGTYYGTHNVTLSTVTGGATIRYTVDGSTPNDSSAVYSAPIAVSASETIKAIATHSGDGDSGVLSAAYTIGAVGSVSVSPSTASIATSGTQGLTATVSGGGLTGTVTWSVVSGGGSVASTGALTATYTAPAGATTAMVKATGSDGTTYGESTITVTLAGVSVAPSRLTVAPGGTQTFTATVTGLSPDTVTWSIASGVGSIDASTGVYTAPGSAGSAVVRATSDADGAYYGECAVTIELAPAPIPDPGGGGGLARGRRGLGRVREGEIWVGGRPLTGLTSFSGEPGVTRQSHDVVGLPNNANSQYHGPGPVNLKAIDAGAGLALQRMLQGWTPDVLVDGLGCRDDQVQALPVWRNLRAPDGRSYLKCSYWPAWQPGGLGRNGSGANDPEQLEFQGNAVDQRDFNSVYCWGQWAAAVSDGHGGYTAAVTPGVAPVGGGSWMLDVYLLDAASDGPVKVARLDRLPELSDANTIALSAPDWAAQRKAGWAGVAAVLVVCLDDASGTWLQQSLSVDARDVWGRAVS